MPKADTNGMQSPVLGANSPSINAGSGQPSDPYSFEDSEEEAEAEAKTQLHQYKQNAVWMAEAVETHFTTLVEAVGGDEKKKNKTLGYLAYYALLQAMPEESHFSTQFWLIFVGMFTAVFSSLYSYSFSAHFFLLGTSPFWAYFAAFTGFVSLIFNVAVGTRSASKSINNFIYKFNHSKLIDSSKIFDACLIIAAIAAAVPNVIFIFQQLVIWGWTFTHSCITCVIVLFNVVAQYYRGLDRLYGVSNRDRDDAIDRRKVMILMLITLMEDGKRKDFLSREDILDKLASGNLFQQKAGKFWGWLGIFLSYYVGFYAYTFFEAVNAHSVITFLPALFAVTIPYVSALMIGIALIAGFAKFGLLGNLYRDLFSEGSKRILDIEYERIPRWWRVTAKILTWSLVWFSVGGACQLVFLYFPIISAFTYAKLWCYLIGGVAALAINVVDFQNFLLSIYTTIDDLWTQYFNREQHMLKHFGSSRNDLVEILIEKIAKTSVLVANSEYGCERQVYDESGQFLGYSNERGKWQVVATVVKYLNENETRKEVLSDLKKRAHFAGMYDPSQTTYVEVSDTTENKLREVFDGLEKAEGFTDNGDEKVMRNGLEINNFYRLYQPQLDAVEDKNMYVFENARRHVEQSKLKKLRSSGGLRRASPAKSDRTFDGESMRYSSPSPVR